MTIRDQEILMGKSINHKVSPSENVVLLDATKFGGEPPDLFIDMNKVRGDRA